MNLRLLVLLPALAAFGASGVAQDPPPAADEPTARLYDLREFIPSAGEGPDLVLAPPREDPAASGSALPIARLLRAFVAPPLVGEEQINPLGKRWLVALARPDQHAWIERFLRSARREREAMDILTIECRCLAIPELVYERDVRPVFDGIDMAKGVEATAKTPHLTRVLAPGPKTTAFLDGLAKLDDVAVVTAPRLAMHALSIGHVSLVKRTSYVRDFDVEIANGTAIADPIVDIVEDGIRFEAAVARLDDDLLGLSFFAHVADLERPIATHKVALGVDHEVTVQLPHLKSTQLETAVALASGHFVVAAPPPLAGKRMVFVVRVVAGEGGAPEGGAPGGKRRDF